MKPLAESLQEKKSDFREFGELAKKVLHYLPNVLSDYHEKNTYRIYSSQIAGTTKYVRPINTDLFCFKPTDFDKNLALLNKTLKEIKKGSLNISKAQKENIDKTLYTMQQSIGAGLDLLVGSNSARKHVGNRFEELMRAVFTRNGHSKQENGSTNPV